MSRIIAHREKPIPNICEFRSDVPGSFQEIFEKMLDKQKRKRYQSATELILDLRKAKADLQSEQFSLAETKTIEHERIASTSKR